MSKALEFLLANKYVLLIALVSFVVQYCGAAYVLKNRKTDFSYSCHTVVWIEGTQKGFNYFCTRLCLWGICFHSVHNLLTN